jgi:hypothetical protein
MQVNQDFGETQGLCRLTRWVAGGQQWAALEGFLDARSVQEALRLDHASRGSVGHQRQIERLPLRDKAGRHAACLAHREGAAAAAGAGAAPAGKH